MDIYVIDAFAEQQFKGNPAAVVPVDEWPDIDLMQSIAAENNLSETAFIKLITHNRYEIRWFSPLTEIDFCGHATLASAYVLFNEYGVSKQIEFLASSVGVMLITHNQRGEIEMTFPCQMPEAVASIPGPLLLGLNKTPVKVLKNRQAYFVILNNAEDVVNVSYDSEQLKKLAPLDVVVTSSSTKYDFVSRYFWPANGGDEDPVTGSIHAGLAPYWAAILKRNYLRAYQASRRGGVLNCRVSQNSVVVSGKGVLYLKGRIFVGEKT